MRICVLVLFFVLAMPVFVPNAALAQTAIQDRGVLIRSIELEGFTLQDKEQFVKIFKPYRNKYLTTNDMDEILQKVQSIYEREGYQQLVTISYQVTKHRLIYTASMTS